MKVVLWQNEFQEFNYRVIILIMEYTGIIGKVFLSFWLSSLQPKQQEVKAHGFDSYAPNYGQLLGHSL